MPFNQNVFNRIMNKKCLVSDPYSFENQLNCWELIIIIIIIINETVNVFTHNCFIVGKREMSKILTRYILDM